MGSGAVEDAGGGGVIGDFFEGKGCAQEIFGEAAATGGIVGGEVGLAGVEMEAAVGPGEEAGELAVGQGAGAVESFANGLSPELGDGLPTAVAKQGDRF